VDVFFERLQTRPGGHAEGDRIEEVRSRPVYALRYGGMVGLTWLDETRPPEGIVWLLCATHLDEHGDESAALGHLAARERDGLFPDEFDYARLELDRRKLETSHFAEMARRDARALLATTNPGSVVPYCIAEVPVAALWYTKGDYLGLYLAVSTVPIPAKASGFELPLTNARFLLIAEAFRQAARSVYGQELLADEPSEYPQELSSRCESPRVFLLLFEVPRGSSRFR
jgi:hypothetical protein